MNLTVNILRFCFYLQAVIESVPLKQKIFSEIEKACPPHCILATNTSSIDLNIVGEKTSSQDRVIGAHFFRLFKLFIFLLSLIIFKYFTIIISYTLLSDSLNFPNFFLL